VESYGQSELGGFVALGRPALEDDSRLGPVGRPLPDKEVRILDSSDREVAAGEIGEICIRGGCMQGYWGRPESTAKALRGGWLHTGDAGTIDADGFVTMRGRFSELLTVGGRTWFPRDVEEALCSQPGIKAAALVGLQDCALGHRPIAFVIADGSPDAALLKAAIQPKLALDLGPLEIVCVQGLPMTPTGKIAKAELRDLAAARRI
jgi:acyl-CoA synthetase (AMP-forming)/AMP-acid ligase II